MADFVGFFQILDTARQDIDGRYTAKDAGELRTGTLAKRAGTNGDQLDACSADNAPHGFVLTNRTLVYSPTTVYADAGEPVTLVRGSNVRFAADVYSFSAGVLPSVGDNLYTGNNGLIALTGAAAGYFGKCIQTGDDVRVAPNTTEALVVCEAKFLV